MDDQTIFTTTNGNVTAIADKSGNNYTFNASSGSTLTAVNMVQNNRNILRFDGNSDATSYTNVGFSATAKHKWFSMRKSKHQERNSLKISCQLSPSSHHAFMECDQVKKPK